MAQKGFTTWADVEKAFYIHAQNNTKKAGKRPIIWEEPFVQGVTIDKSVIVHVWHNFDTLVNAAKQGYDVILSHGYYQDRQDPFCSGNCSSVYWMFSWTYRTMYKNDPVIGRGLTEAEAKHILGGESTIWAESVDEVNVDQMDNTRAAAIAERFWSHWNVTDPDKFERRQQRYRCLAVRRGISAAGPLSTDYCEVNWPFPGNNYGTMNEDVQSTSDHFSFGVILAIVGCFLGGSILAVITAYASFFAWSKFSRKKVNV
jgi:N-acetyl-beta-hexosaminidase